MTVPALATFKLDAPNRADGRALLGALAAESAQVAAVFLDLQHREILDKLRYGNESARQRGRAGLPQMDAGDAVEFVSLAAHILRPSGHLFLWLDKFILAQGIHLKWLAASAESAPLQIVDLITWRKSKIGLGYRTRRSCEYLLVAQRLPTRARGVWTRHNIPDDWAETPERSVHPHRKPVGLQGALIDAVTRESELVVDPCAGSYSVLDACRERGRRFLGCDLNEWRAGAER